MDGWGKIKRASIYAGVSERTLRTWLKNGLKHSQMPTGTILIKFAWIDAYLERFTCETAIDDVIENICKEFN